MRARSIAQVLLLSVICSSGLAYGQSVSSVTIDRIVAVVNDGVILQSELDRAVRTTQAQMAQRKIAPPSDSVLRSQVLERLITVRVQTQKAQEAGIRIDDRELNEVMTTIAQQNGMTLAQFAESVRSARLDFLSVREQVRDEVLVTRVRQREVDSRISVTEQDVDLYLANNSASKGEYRISHILIALPEGSNAEQKAAARIKADSILARLKFGEDFAAIAAAESDGQQALQGGDLDWRKVSDLPSVFVDAAGKLKETEISPILETTSGLHIVKLMGKRNEGGEKNVTETRAHHILLMPNAVRNDDATLALANQVSARLKKGETMEAIAKELSDDTGSKANGGDLGFQAVGIFVPEFQIKLDSLAPGETSEPFRTQFGWHIARVDTRRTRDVSTETQRGQARQALGSRKSTEEYDLWLRRLRDEAYVELRSSEDAKDRSNNTDG